MRKTPRPSSMHVGRSAPFAELGRDVRHACRLLGRSPAYSVLVTVVLALGVAANGAVFSLFKSLALDPVPGVNRSGGLSVLLGHTSTGEFTPISHPDYRALVAEQRSFVGIAGTSSTSFSLGIGTESRRVQGELVTGDYFDVLGVGAQLGRTLQSTDDLAPGRHPVVVISDHLWRSAFDADPGVIGRAIHVNAVQLTIVGVADPEFHGTIVSWVVDLFVPIMMQGELQGQDVLTARATPLLWGLGRLATDVSTTAAAEEADLLSARVAAEHPEGQMERRATVVPIWRSPYGAQTYFLPLVAVLASMGALLLLVVCANVTSLVLARGLSRQAEVAARLALGASRGSILRLLLVEGLILAVPGTVLGLLSVRALTPLLDIGQLAARAGSPITVVLDTSTDGLVVIYAVVLGLGSALAFSFLPARRASRMDLARLVRNAPSARTGSPGRLRDVLVTGQIAVSVVLLVSAALILRSLEAAQTADAGFDPNRVAIFGLDLRSSGYGEDPARAFYRQLLDAARADPRIESATLASEVPLQFVDGGTVDLTVEGFTPRPGESTRVSTNTVAPDYFRTLRIDLLAGRDFNDLDGPGTEPVIIVNETMARRFWATPDQAIGKRVQVATPGDLSESTGTERPWRSIVGVARDIKYARLTESPRPYAYLPSEQRYEPTLALYVRAGDAEVALVERGRAVVQALDSNLPVQGRMLTEISGLGSVIFTIAARVLLTLGMITLALTALGTYGLVSYTAKQRTREIGIRLAIGANGTDIAARFIRRGLVLGGIGAVVGVALAATLTRFLASVLYGVTGTDVVSFAAATMIVLAIVLSASLVPAWRASRTEPLTALREP